MRGAAIVTGARGGLGRAIAEALAADGHPVVAVIRAPDAAVDAWAARLPSPAVVACVDLAQSGLAQIRGPALTPPVAAPAPLEAALSAALDALGAAPAIVVHATGAAERGAITEAAPGAVARAVSVHADALVALARVLDERGASTTVADRGRIVALGLAGVERLGGYRAWPVQAAAKAAQLVVARSLALALAPRGITVNVVAPGHVDAGAGVAPEVVARIPAGRPGAPADVVAAVRYLLSPGAAYVTGAVIPVAGGFAL